MRPDFLMLADRASISEGGKVDIEGAGVTHVRVDEFPGSVRLTAVARMVGEEDDQLRTEPVKLVIQWFRPNGSLAAETDPLEIPPEHLRTPHQHADEERSYLWLVDMPSVTFSEPGVYRLGLVLDGETVVERTLAVLQEPNAND